MHVFQWVGAKALTDGNSTSSKDWQPLPSTRLIRLVFRPHNRKFLVCVHCLGLSCRDNSPPLSHVVHSSLAFPAQQQQGVDRHQHGGTHIGQYCGPKPRKADDRCLEKYGRLPKRRFALPGPSLTTNDRRMSVKIFSIAEARLVATSGNASIAPVG